LQATDKKTFVLELGKPSLGAGGLAKPSAVVPFICPPASRHALRKMIKEAIGRGRTSFVKEEWQPGNQVVYVRTRSTSRARAASGAAGGKRVYVDRLIWRYIPDARRPRRPRGR